MGRFVVVYHPDPEHFLDPLNPDFPPVTFTPTIGLKVTLDGVQYGHWLPLPEGHTPEEALDILAQVARTLADDLAARRLRAGVAPVDRP